MACTSTRPSPALPLPVAVPQDIAELQAELARLRLENHKLQRINGALIERIESGMTRGNDPYAAFQHSVVLAEQVRERTDALNQAMAELKAGNHLLSEARLRAETAHQHLIDAIESISDAFVLFDAEQRIVLFNSRFKAFWSNSRVRINAGMRLTEVKRLMTEQRPVHRRASRACRRKPAVPPAERALAASQRTADPGRGAGDSVHRHYRRQTQRNHAP